MAMQVNIFIDLLVYFENVGKHSSVQAVLFLKLEKYKKVHLVSFRKVVERAPIERIVFESLGISCRKLRYSVTEEVNTAQARFLAAMQPT